MLSLVFQHNQTLGNGVRMPFQARKRTLTPFFSGLQAAIVTTNGMPQLLAKEPILRRPTDAYAAGEGTIFRIPFMYSACR